MHSSKAYKKVGLTVHETKRINLHDLMVTCVYIRFVHATIAKQLSSVIRSVADNELMAKQVVHVCRTSGISSNPTHLFTWSAK